MSQIVELIDQQAEAHRRAAIEAYGQRDAMAAVREENARLGDQIEQLQKRLPGGVAGKAGGAGGGSRLYGPDGKELPIPEKPPVYVPPPAPTHPPAQPFPVRNTAPLGLGGGGGGGGGASTGGGGAAGSPGLLHAIKGPAFASFAWIKANGIKTTVKIPNPANPLALFSKPPDLLDCAAYDCSAQFPPEAIFLDPDAVANLPKRPTISVTSSGGGAHAPYTGPSASDPGPTRHVQQVGTPTDPGGGGSSGGNSGNTGDLGNGSGGAPIGGGKSLQINVQHPPTPRPTVTPDGVLLSRQLAAVLAVMGKVADAVTARGPSTNTEFRRNKF